MKVQSGTVTIRFYPPIDTSMWTLKNLDEQIVKIREDYIRWEGEYAEAREV